MSFLDGNYADTVPDHDVGPERLAKPLQTFENLGRRRRIGHHRISAIRALLSEPKSNWGKRNPRCTPFAKTTCAITDCHNNGLAGEASAIMIAASVVSFRG